MISKHQLHPDARSIYVEGRFDRYFVTRVLAIRGTGTDVPIHAASTLSVNRQDISESHLLPGAKGKLIYLARRAHEHDMCSQILCVVDRDADLDGMTLPESGLIATEFSCCEMYAMSHRALTSYLAALGIRAVDAPALLGAVQQVSSLTYLLRKANFDHQLGCAQQDLSRYLTFRDSGIIFDSDRFILNMATSAPNARASQDVLREAVARASELPADFRAYANGHDCLAILRSLSTVQTTLQRSVVRTEQFVESVLVASIEEADILSTQMYSQIGSWVDTPTST